MGIRTHVPAKQRELRMLFARGVFMLSLAVAKGDAAMGPLRVSRRNPRYFETPAGTVVYLTGSHTWANLQERTYQGRAVFDYGRYLDFLTGHGHNFMRMWAWEHARVGLADLRPWAQPDLHGSIPRRSDRRRPGCQVGPGPQGDGCYAPPG